MVGWIVYYWDTGEYTLIYHLYKPYSRPNQGYKTS